MQPEEESAVLESQYLLFCREIVWLIPRGMAEQIGNGEHEEDNWEVLIRGINK